MFNIKSHHLATRTANNEHFQLLAQLSMLRELNAFRNKWNSTLADR